MVSQIGFSPYPRLYSNGYPSPTVDDEITSAYRRGVLGDSYWTVQQFLTRRHSSFERLRVCRRDFSFDLGGNPFPAGPATKSFQLAKRAIEVAAQNGYFCYDEMFVWAHALLEDHPSLPDWLARRFTLVIIDEMQDTFERHASFLKKVFPRDSDDISVQRIGDPNQEIFDLPDSRSGTVDTYPDPDPTRCLGIPNSYRFGNDIATLAAPFAVHPVGTHGLSGVASKGVITAAQECRHAIFVFPDNRTDGVLEAFGRHALSTLGDELINTGSVHAVGHIHQNDPKVVPGHTQYPKSVGHYWDGYTASLSRVDPNPRWLAQYIRVAQGLVASRRALSPGVDKFASGILELARRIGDIGDLRRNVRTHRTVVDALAYAPDKLTDYHRILSHFLINWSPVSEDLWNSNVRDLISLAVALCNGTTDSNKADGFLDWPKDGAFLSAEDANVSSDLGPNIFRYSDSNGTIDIRLGSIHSVKGQTHLATLLLSTYWHAHSAKEMMPWLLGGRLNGGNTGPRNTQRLLHTYVAMTRPRHLLCLAIPRLALGGGNAHDVNIASLRGRGWRVAEIADGAVHWRD